MRFAESYGDGCRYCGSTQIIVWPLSAAGSCAVCSSEANAWATRRDELARRRATEGHRFNPLRGVWARATEAVRAGTGG